MFYESTHNRRRMARGGSFWEKCTYSVVCHNDKFLAEVCDKNSKLPNYPFRSVTYLEIEPPVPKKDEGCAKEQRCIAFDETVARVYLTVRYEKDQCLLVHIR
jgi:hypothetical protein